MGKRIGVAVAGLATFVTSLGVFGDDVGRLISHTPHRPPVSIPRKPVPFPHEPVPVPHQPVPVPHQPVPVRHEPVPVPPVVVDRTKHLSREDAETVTKAACELKVLDEFVFAESDDERWRIASEYLSDVVFGEDKLAAATDLAQDMLDGEDVDATDAYCDLLG